MGAISPFFCSSKRWGFPASFFFATGNKLPRSGLCVKRRTGDGAVSPRSHSIALKDYIRMFGMMPSDSD
jgi:hypothetical protein